MAYEEREKLFKLYHKHSQLPAGTMAGEHWLPPHDGKVSRQSLQAREMIFHRWYTASSCHSPLIQLPESVTNIPKTTIYTTLKMLISTLLSITVHVK